MQPSSTPNLVAGRCALATPNMAPAAIRQSRLVTINANSLLMTSNTVSNI
jgi:hypothetical protein